jgi:hypothetical protein
MIKPKYTGDNPGEDQIRRVDRRALQHVALGELRPDASGDQDEHAPQNDQSHDEGARMTSGGDRGQSNNDGGDSCTVLGCPHGSFLNSNTQAGESNPNGRWR